jgi:hypothetical protein
MPAMDAVPLATTTPAPVRGPVVEREPGGYLSLYPRYRELLLVREKLVDDEAKNPTTNCR